MLKIGHLKLESNLILAPMSGVTDFPFRMLNRKFGFELAFTEMLNARSLSHKSKKTKQMLFSTAQDRPLGAQLLGKEPKYILRGLEVLKDYKFDLLDFNAACPAKKVTRRGEGARLLRDAEKLKQLLKLLVKNSSWPLTIKIRTGWDDASVNAREVGLLAEDCGVQAIFIHGRTKMAEYHGDVDYRAIRKVKESVKIPVVASGNIFSAQSAKKMLDETGCDGLLVARGALGNPWILEEIKSFLKDGSLPPRPSRDEIIKVMLEHLNSYIDYYGERNGVIIFRKFFAWYTKGFRKIRPAREKSSRAKTREQMASIIEECRLIR